MALARRHFANEASACTQLLQGCRLTEIFRNDIYSKVLPCLTMHHLNDCCTCRETLQHARSLQLLARQLSNKTACLSLE